MIFARLLQLELFQFPFKIKDELVNAIWSIVIVGHMGTINDHITSEVD